MWELKSLGKVETCWQNMYRCKSKCEKKIYSVNGTFAGLNKLNVQDCTISVRNTCKLEKKIHKKH